VNTLQAAHGFYQKYGFTQIAKEDLPSTFSISPLDTVFFQVTTEDLHHKLFQLLD